MRTKAEQFGSHIRHRYSEFIEVTAGDEIYPGPCFPNLGFYISSFNSSKVDIGKNTPCLARGVFCLVGVGQASSTVFSQTNEYAVNEDLLK